MQSEQQLNVNYFLPQLNPDHHQNVFNYNNKSYIKIKKYIYDQQKLLGKGSYGTVYLGFDTQIAGQKVAVKKIQIPKDPDKVRQIQMLISSTQNQIYTFLSLHHPNILQLHDFVRVQNSIYLILQYCNQKDLTNFLKQKKMNKKVSLPELRYYFLQILEGVKQMHAKKIVHRDLKPQNILVKDQILKIADFGFSKVIIKQSLLQSTAGTQVTAAPQIIFQKPYTNKCDIYSLGCIFYWMIYSRYPYEQINSEVYKQQNLGFPESVQITDQIKSCLIQMLRFDEENRIDMQSLIKLRIFRSDEIIKQLGIKPEALSFRQSLNQPHSMSHKKKNQKIQAQIPTDFTAYIQQKIQEFQNKQIQQKAFKSIKKTVDYQIGKIQFFRYLADQLKDFRVQGKPELQKYQNQITLLKDLIILSIQKYSTYRMDQLLNQLLQQSPLVLIDQNQFDQFKKLSNSKEVINCVQTEFNFLVNKTKQSQTFDSNQKEYQNKCIKYRIYDSIKSVFSKQIINPTRFKEHSRVLIFSLVFYLKNDIPAEESHIKDVKKSRGTILLIHHLFILFMQDTVFHKGNKDKINFSELIQDEYLKINQQQLDRILINIQRLLKRFVQ